MIRYNLLSGWRRGAQHGSIINSIQSLSYVSTKLNNSSESSIPIEKDKDKRDETSRFYEKFTFGKDFLSTSSLFHKDSKNFSSIYAVPEGGFVKVDPALLDKHLPEGLSNEVQEGFQQGFSDSTDDHKVWMIRESSKLVFRLIDEYESVLTNHPNKHVEIMHKRHSVHVPLLTDKNEWPDSVIKVTNYGNELVNCQLQQFQGKKKYMHIAKEHDCAVDACINKLKDKLPNKIMLLGT